MSYELKNLAPSVRAQINAAGLPERTVGLELSDLRPYQGGTLEGVQKWLGMVRSGNVVKARGERTCGLGLLLIGEPGHGKTTLACTVLQELLRTTPREVLGYAGTGLTRPGFFTDYPKLLRVQQKSWDEESDDPDKWLIDSVYGEAPSHMNVKVLILDDLGKEYRTASGWAENTFDAILRARFNAGLPTIITTNNSLQKWGNMYGKAMESFAHEAFIPLAVVSEEGDRRL